MDLQLVALPEREDDRKSDGEHQQPDPHAGDPSRSGGAQLLGFERVADGHPPVHGDAHDHVDAAVCADEIEVLQEGAEWPELAGPLVIGSVHLGG